MAFLGPVAAALSAVGTIISTIGTLQAAAGAKEAAAFEAEQLRKKAMQAEAVGQRKMFAERRRGDLALSTLRARAAAGGFNPDSPTDIALGADIVEEREMNALTAFYTGREQAAGLRDQATATLISGQSKAAQYTGQAWGGLLAGTGSLIDKYAPKFG